jgi:outer membrane protein TolC
VDYNNFFNSTASLGAMTFTFNPTSNLNVSVGQLIFSGSYIIGIQTAKLFKEVTETSREKTELEIKAQVSQAYYLSLVSDRSRSIVGENLNNMKDILKKTQAMVQVGIAEDLDYDQLSVQANMLENALKSAERQVEISLNMLRLQMGLDAVVELVLTDNLEDIVLNADFNSSLLMPFELNNHYDYQLLQLQTSVSEKQVLLEKAAYLPTITGFYNYTEKIKKPELDFAPKHVIGFNVSIPIFASGIKQARLNQAKINLMITENQKELVSEQLQIQERQLRYNLKTALEQYQSQKANAEVAERVYKNIKLKYQQGIVSSLDLTTANSNYLQTENSFISSYLQLLNTYTEMEKFLSNL